MARSVDPQIASMVASIVAFRSARARPFAQRKGASAIWFSLFAFLGFATATTAAEFEPRAVAITQATVVIAPGQQIENGRVILRDGLIVAVGADVAIPPDAEAIEVTGHV